MEINNSPVFNPAANKPAVNNEPSKLTELARGGEDEDKKKVESSEKPENESDGKVLEALKDAINETVGLQTKKPEPVDEDVIVELSNAAKQISAQQAEEATKAKIATINAAVNVFTGPDVATAALGNSGGSNAQVNIVT